MLPWFVALPALVLNEVLYDPDGADTGREFVEILNVSESAQSLESVELQVGDGARPGTWRTAWPGSSVSLAPGELFVIGGDSLQERQALLGLALQNGPDAVRLLRAGQLLDLLGYGDLSSPDLFEGTPAADVSGSSLSRIPDGKDTQDNASDFQATSPTPGRLNAPRRALRIALVPPDPTRLWPWRSLALQVQVHNAGLEAWEADTYGLSVSLHAVLGEPAIDAWTRRPLQSLDVEGPFPHLAPGDSTAHRIRWQGELGLFQVQVALQPGAPDEAGTGDSLFLRVGAGPIVVNEILFAPEPGEEEWIELYNRDGRAHDLNGWTLADGTGRPSALRADAPLQPGQYALLEATAATSLAPPVLRVRVTPWPSLNNSDGDDGFADRVILRDAAGIIDDALAYSAAWSAGRGRSLERLTPDPDARGLLWAPSKDPRGSTPGRVNSARAPAGWSTQLDLQPNPFSPDGDGYEDLLTIAFEVPSGSLGFRLSLFDSSGRRRRQLAGDRLGPGPRRLVWDGTDDGGRLLGTGVYVLHLQLLGLPQASPQLRSIGLVRP